ncbi:hypothetical protein BX666DRAFT_2023612 [Dichotomocladium elegans]|nr:hypothetical protein BX666DRAFT_2023612 [Dichotomocladium elegans]
MNIVAPCPKKPSSIYSPHPSIRHGDDDVCQELRQILTANHYYSQEEIARTGNPLPQDSSFIVPLHHLQVSEAKLRPRSYSVGDRNHLVVTSMLRDLSYSMVRMPSSFNEPVLDQQRNVSLRIT